MGPDHRANGEAERFLISIENDKQQGTYIDHDNARLRFRTYYESRRGLSVDHATLDRIDREFRLHIPPTFADSAMGT